jgi:two-component system, OmpR family, alkaline phosphatase synthesis response regulator PhoP
MKPRRILVIEDDAAIRRGVVDALRFAHYETLEAATGDKGLDMAIRCDSDLVLLDLVLPGLDGLYILEKVRAARPTLPVIVLTARGEETDRVKGLSLGADDYVVKPFSVKELLARVEAVLRRSAERPVDVSSVSFPGGVADIARLEVRYDDGGRAELTDREAALLRYLAANPGRAISREELLSRVWRIDPAGIDTRTIDMHIARLREKLRDDPSSPAAIVTVRGKGYAFASPGGAS